MAENGIFRLKGSGLGPPDQAAGQSAGGDPVAEDLDATHERVAVSHGPLQEAAPAGGQVMEDLRPGDGEPVEIDDVEVGPVPGAEHAPVVEAHQAGRGPALLLDDP